MRQGENAVDVIDRVKERIRQIEPGLPPGMEIVPIYDRSALIRRAIDNVSETLVEVVLTVAFVVLLFLWHVPSALIPLITIPVAVLVAFIPFRAMGITANIMSLGGIAIAIGRAGGRGDRRRGADAQEARAGAARRIDARPSPDRPRGGQGGGAGELLRAARDRGVVPPGADARVAGRADVHAARLHQDAHDARGGGPRDHARPARCACSSRACGASSSGPRGCAGSANAVLVGRIRSEESHPISRFLMRMYEPVVRWSLRWKWSVIGGAAALVVVTVPVFTHLGSEFMPPLREGSLFYMPTTMPGISISEAQKLLQVSDRAIKQFPEVDRVLGKAGRADTSTDPAPLSMLETVITLKPTSEWRRVDTWYSGWAPEWMKRVLRHVTPDHISEEQLVEEMNAALTYPGVSNAWTMPIKARIDMLTTGIRTPVGLKISGADFAEIEKIGTAIEAALPAVSGTRNVFAERTGSGFFLDIEWNRDALARYGLSVEAAQSVVQNAIGGENVTTTIEGRERYPVNVRYMRDFRSDTDALARVLVPASDGQRQIPLGELARVKVATGPAMIRDEDGLLTGYVFVDVAGRDISSYVDEASRVVREQVKLPPGYAVLWSGQYEAMARVRARLAYIIPFTLFVVFVLLYLNTRSLVKTAIVLLAVPFSAVGAIWYLYLLGYNMSIAVWVGLIALLGVDAETGVFMLLYLDLAYEKASREGRLRTLADLQATIVEGAAKRLRPKFMTVATMFVGLIPIMWATGTGSGRVEADRRADGWRHLHVVRPRARRLPGDLRNLEVALRDEARPRRTAAAKYRAAMG